MKKKYNVKREKISEALEELETFEDKMIIFKERFPNIEYISGIHKDKDQWNTTVNITKDE